MSAEAWLKLLDHYGIPLALLAGLAWVMVPIFRKLTDKHIEAIDALVKTQASMDMAVRGISSIIEKFGGASLEAHAETHSRLDEIENFLEFNGNNGHRKHRPESDPRLKK